MANKKSDEQKRLDKVQKVTRIRQVCEWMMDGNNSEDILIQIQNMWNLKDRQAYYYIEWAMGWFEKLIQAKVEQRRALHISMRMKMYKDALEDKSLKSRDRYMIALAVIQDVAKIEGLYKETIKIETEHTENIEITLNLGESGQQQIEKNIIQLPTTVDNQLSKGDS